MARYSPKYFGQDKGVLRWHWYSTTYRQTAKLLVQMTTKAITFLIYSITTPLTLSLIFYRLISMGQIDIISPYSTFLAINLRHDTKPSREKMFQVESTEDEEQLIAWELITREWENICRLMISLGQHKTSQSVLIKKLWRNMIEQ